ncbi:MAG: hypothetical protein COU33_01905 [Candidatus Magasanikbacteria bacterium CG10_big_fil_rev_8_21_14_0_10_43_6]|uniref:Prepilin peptidase n=1 Tax=Candidatus Magasanikbacteria bacterium CG10_big_fil_rev_8_21_14_0_10_43_6 TaxID=1974650 RepID=A0A2M6W1G5_9BACT|nr:MAG: hypothetical protein COU33_01905 [Candidatus Magasanikbacteria bacterium CG10_big_fil_rev_8_21_14_0_10_43_6]
MYYKPSFFWCGIIAYMEFFFIFVLGLILGSFLNVVIYRLHKKEALTGRSRCTVCKKQIFWYDNIPLASFLLLNGKCRFCRKKISLQYPIIEFATGGIFVALYSALTAQFDTVSTQAVLSAVRYFSFSMILIVIFVYDLKWYLILDKVTLPAILWAFCINLLLDFSWQNMVFGGIIASGFFFMQYVLSQGRWIGGGDVRLGALIGVMLGWQLVLASLFFAYVLGAVVGLALIISGRKKLSSKLPFGSFLATSTLVILVCGNSLVSWYISLITF